MSWIKNKLGKVLKGVTYTDINGKTMPMARAFTKEQLKKNTFIDIEFDSDVRPIRKWMKGLSNEIYDKKGVSIHVPGENTPDDHGFIYVISDGKYTMIGMSRRPQKRLDEIQRTVPSAELVNKITVGNMLKTKRKIFQHFDQKQLKEYHGMTGWFELSTDDALAYIKRFEKVK